MRALTDSLAEATPLRRLLARYRDLGDARQDAEWHDRVMELEGTQPAELSKLHGILLAKGWLDTRVGREALETPGALRACYRATREGLVALRRAESPTPADTDEVVFPSDDNPPTGEPAESAGSEPW